jgi:hypothetical protein
MSGRNLIIGTDKNKRSHWHFSKSREQQESYCEVEYFVIHCGSKATTTNIHPKKRFLFFFSSSQKKRKRNETVRAQGVLF